MAFVASWLQYRNSRGEYTDPIQGGPVMNVPGKILIAVAIVLAPGVAVSDEAVSGVGSTSDAALRDIAASLRTLVREQRILIVMRRLELAERRLGPQQDELRAARDEVRAISQEVAQLESIAESFRDQVAESIAQGGDPASERSEIAHLESMLEAQRERLETAERRVMDAEVDLDRARRDVDRIEPLLEELLEEIVD
jgi:chromosome segregation ATPase